MVAEVIPSYQFAIKTISKLLAPMGKLEVKRFVRFARLLPGFFYFLEDFLFIRAEGLIFCCRATYALRGGMLITLLYLLYFEVAL